MATHQSLIFMHDAAPCHRSKIVKQFLTENYMKILDWPGNSPNLNPIKNLWYKMKDLVSQKQPGSSSELVLQMIVQMQKLILKKGRQTPDLAVSKFSFSREKEYRITRQINRI